MLYRFVMEKLKIRYFPMQEVDKLGVQKCIELALNHINPKYSNVFPCNLLAHIIFVNRIFLNSNDLPLHLSFDIDALDPSDAFSTGTPVMGGLTLREGLQIVEHVRSTGA